MTPMSTVRRAVIIAFAISLSLTFSTTMVTSETQSARPSETPSEAVFFSHKMSQDDVDNIRASIGVRDPSVNYNVIVDGFGTGLAPPTEESLLSMVGNVNVLDYIEADFSALPDAIDLSVLPTFPAVGNQMSQPSCSAWAGAYYAYGFLEAVDNDWTMASSGAQDQLISPAWTYSRTNAGVEGNGTWIDDNMLVLRDWGAPTMQTMPYDEDEYLDLGSPSAFREAPAHRAHEVFYIEYTDASTIDQIKLLVSDGIPVTFALDAGEFFSDPEGGLIDNFTLSSAEYSSLFLNHAQTIVGYDDAVTDDGEVGAFRVVNSWGTEFADEGFYWFTYDAMIELGELDLAVLNYISDIEDYSPSLVANWHFNEAPSRLASIELGIGPQLSPLATKSPFSIVDTFPSHEWPSFMCLDVTEFASFYEDSSDEFFVSVGASPSGGMVSSFKVEFHSGIFVPGVATRTSGQSEDVPLSTPGTATVTLERYDPIAADDALDIPGAELLSASEVAWVPVADESATDHDSMQSGDVADGECTSISLAVQGPSTISFRWRVSSESGDDVLSFSAPFDDILSSVSGEVGWSEETHSLGEGTHSVYWNYTKGSSTSSGEDTAWLDEVNISIPSPQFSLNESYDVVCHATIVVTPFDVVNPTGSSLTFWYDWGDGSPVIAGDPLEDFSASHSYDSVDDFDLTVSLSDDYDNNVSQSAVVHVLDENAKPVAESMTIAPMADYYSPDDSVRFDVVVVDAEGDVVTVELRIDSLGVLMTQTDSPAPDTPMVFSFDYVCPESDDTPYVVVVEVSDDADHISWDWDTAELELLVNSPPIAELVSDVQQGNTLTVFAFDASGSSDAETSSELLEARWDWDGDGIWDTGWSDSLQETHQFLQLGSYTVSVEIRDAAGLTSVTSIDVEVSDEAIPEFSSALVPVVAVLALLLVLGMYYWKRRDT